MAKLSLEQIAQGVAEKALEESVYKGKSIKEWVKIIVEQEPCEDCISREWLKTAIHNFYQGLMHTPTEEDIQAYIDVAPSVQPKAKIESEG